jgi:hypothetical protein
MSKTTYNIPVKSSNIVKAKYLDIGKLEMKFTDPLKIGDIENLAFDFSEDVDNKYKIKVYKFDKDGEGWFNFCEHLFVGQKRVYIPNSDINENGNYTSTNFKGEECIIVGQMWIDNILIIQMKRIK